MISILWRIRSFFAAMFAETTRRDTDEGDTGQPRQVMYLERRFEKRAASMQSCQLGVMNPLSPDTVEFEEWAGVTVNQSKSGMLLLLSSAPPQGKLLEVHTDGTSVRPSFSLVEVRWSKPVRKTSEGQLHLVGCRTTFGPSHYWAF